MRKKSKKQIDRKPNGRVFIGAFVPPGFRDELLFFAQREHRSLSNAVELAIVRFIESIRQGEGQKGV